MPAILLGLVGVGCKDMGKKPPQALADSAASAPAAAPANSASDALKACDLLTAERISQVTHHALKAGLTTNDYMGDSQCKYANADGSPGGVMVALHKQGSIENYRKVPGSTEIKELGDAAVWNASTAQLAVSRGQAVFSISFLTPPAKEQWAIQLARNSLVKLVQ